MTPQNARQCLKLLSRYQYCDERGQNAWSRFRRRPDTATGKREQELAERWDGKAVVAWDAAISILQAAAKG